MTDRGSVVDEFDGVHFGDRRLEHRLRRVVSAMEANPQASFVEQAGDVASLEALYRFLANERVEPERIFEAHARKTAQRAAERECVLVVHDTTEFRFGGAKYREGLGRVSTDKKDGFLAHYLICLGLDGEPLGTLDLHAWSRLDTKKRPKAKGRLKDPERESLRWIESAERVAERLAGRVSSIHVMDREGDQFELFAMLLDQGERFVIRMGHDRRLSKGRGKDGEPRLNEVLAAGPAMLTREVEVGRRERDPSTKKRATFPPRAARRTRFEVRAKRLELHRSHMQCTHLPQVLELNFIEAREVDSPPNASPIVWRIVTTEPIETQAEVLNVIDIYRRRWLIEEFFKAIKSGCNFESHQLESVKRLLVALVLESTIAWQLLRLRHVARHQPDAPGEPLLTTDQLEALSKIRRVRGEPPLGLTVTDVIDELARLGVHIPANGPPGWALLKRGLRKLDMLAEGIRLAHAALGVDL